MKENLIAPESEYILPENIGKSSDKVGVDHIILHYALWNNHYSNRLQQAGIRYNADSKTLTVPYSDNLHIQVINPCADFYDAITCIGLLAWSENLFVAGKIKEFINVVGNEEMSVFGFATTDEDVCQGLGYQTNNAKVAGKLVESINRCSMITGLYRVKADPKFNGGELQGCRQSQSGNILKNRTIRLIHKYSRNISRNGKGENTLFLDGEFVKSCHEVNYTIKYKKLFELRSKLRKNKLENEAVIGLYLWLLGNMPEKIGAGRYHLIHDIQRYFQIVAPKLISESAIDKKLYAVQLEIYAEVKTKFRKDLCTALDRLQELKLITGWKDCLKKDVKRDKRAKTNFVNLKKASGLMIWM